MVETITPVVHGGRATWRGTLALHVVGAAATASAFGLTLGWLGALLGAPWQRPGLLVLAAVAALFALGELTPLRVPFRNCAGRCPTGGGRSSAGAWRRLSTGRDSGWAS